MSKVKATFQFDFQKCILRIKKENKNSGISTKEAGVRMHKEFDIPEYAHIFLAKIHHIHHTYVEE